MDECPKGGEHIDVERKMRLGPWRIFTCQKCGRITFKKKDN